MKLTKARLKEIIEEELGEVIRPHRITPGIPPIRPGELRPPVTPTAPTSSQGAGLDDLFQTVVATHKVAKADPSVPEHVVRSLSQIANQIASLMSVSEEKTKVSKTGQERVSKKIAHLIGDEGKPKDQAAAIAYSMEKRGDLK